MFNEIVLTEEQAKPFREKMTSTQCNDPRHKKSVELRYLPIKGYPHSGGWKVPGVAGDPDEDGLYWLYITCPRCGYDWAIWKLGVSRSFDPTKEQAQKPINWNEPHATAKLLKRYGPKEGQEHDPTEDLPRSEEDRRDYLPEPQEAPE
jgi:hypothetical protein